MSKIIAISNQKGGVSKTTTAFNVGACMALEHGKKVLLVDIDLQANLSDYLGFEYDGKPTMTNLIDEVSVNAYIPADRVIEAIRHSDRAGVDYIPADIGLASMESRMLMALSKETILKRILSEEVTGRYDYVIIDCLPSLGTLLVNALVAADKVLIPVQTQKFSVDGLQALEGVLKQVNSALNPNVSLFGVFPTMVERTTVSRDAVEELTKKYGDKLFKTAISKSVEAARSSASGIPLCKTTCKLGEEYKALTAEILEREGKTNE